MWILTRVCVSLSCTRRFMKLSSAVIWPMRWWCITWRCQRRRSLNFCVAAPSRSRAFTRASTSSPTRRDRCRMTARQRYRPHTPPAVTWPHVWWRPVTFCLCVWQAVLSMFEDMGFINTYKIDMHTLARYKHTHVSLCLFSDAIFCRITLSETHASFPDDFIDRHMIGLKCMSPEQTFSTAGLRDADAVAGQPIYKSYQGMRGGCSHTQTL